MAGYYSSGGKVLSVTVSLSRGQLLAYVTCAKCAPSHLSSQRRPASPPARAVCVCASVVCVCVCECVCVPAHVCVCACV